MLEVPLVKIIDLDLARVIQQTNNDNSTGVVEHFYSADGYKAAIAAYEKETAFLREQLQVVIQALAGK